MKLGRVSFTLFVSFIVLFWLLLFSLEKRLVAAELLVNPGFEAGIANWTPSPGTTLFTLVNSPVYSGSWAAAVSSASSSTKAIVQNVAGVAAGTGYMLSGYGYQDDANVDLIRLRLAWYVTADCSGSQLDTVDSNELTVATLNFVFLTTGVVTAPFVDYGGEAQ